jgi:VanZ family protein
MKLNIFSNRSLNICFALFWTIGIFIGCSLPGKHLPSLTLFDNFDKLVHFFFFFFFVFFWQKCFLTNSNNLFKIILIAILYGWFIEIYQKYCVLGRNFDLWDIVADAIGACSILFIKNKLIMPNNTK